MQDSAVASVQPRARQRSSTISSTGRSSSAKRYRRAARAAPLASASAAPRRPARRSGRRGSRSRGRRSSPRPRPRRRRLPRAPARPPTRSAPKNRSTRRTGGRARASTRRTGSVSSAARPEPLQLARRPRKHDDRRARRLEHEAGRRAREPEDVAPSGSVACFVTPCAKSAYGRFSRSATRARSPSISASSSASTTSSRPGGPATSSTVRSSCVGPSPPETRQQVGVEPVPQRRLELVRLVADDRDPRGLDAEREQLSREERAVQVGPLAADELAAGDDDRRARRASSAARGEPAGVTSVSARAAGAATALPFSVDEHVLRGADVEPEPLARTRCVCPCSSVPWRGRLPARRRVRTIRYELPRRRAQDEPASDAACGFCGRAAALAVSCPWQVRDLLAALPPNRQAAMTSAVTTRDRGEREQRRARLDAPVLRGSRRRAARPRRDAASSSSPTTKRELYSST